MSTGVMKSLRFTEFGPPSVLRIEEVPIPEPGEGEASKLEAGFLQRTSNLETCHQLILWLDAKFSRSL